MNKISLILLYITLLLLIYWGGTTDEILYSQQPFLEFLPYILILVPLSIILNLILSISPIKKLIIKLIVALSTVIILLSYLYCTQIKRERDLKKYGQPIKGVVYKKWYDTYKNKSKWLLRCKYIVDGKIFSTYSETDKENKFKIGDTLTIIYSKRAHQNCIIKELPEN